MKARMSCFVTRPPRPVPCTWPVSTPCSDAMRATTGDTKALPFSEPASAAACAGATGCWLLGAISPTPSLAAAIDASAAACVAGSGTGSGSGAAGSAAPAAAPPICASFAPTSTVSPSCTRICVTTPDAGLGTSVSTLSVEISRSGSSASTVSPSRFSHFVTVPSETDTPICGIATSVAVSVAIGSSLILRELAKSLHDILDLRDECLLERRRERYRRVGCCHAANRCVEILERLLGDRRRDLAAESAGAVVLVQHEHLRRLAHRGEHSVLVPRHDGAKVDDLNRDTVVLE